MRTSTRKCDRGGGAVLVVGLLAERGLLSAEEIAALADARTWKHIDTGVEHTDPEAVELYERVCEALQ